MNLSKSDELRIYTDGASRGNPGKAALAFIMIKNEELEPFYSYSEYIGRTTNNVAEYKAIISALEEAKKITSAKVSVFTDSQLVVRQVKKEYRVKAAHLRPLLDHIYQLIKSFDKVEFTHLPRENKYIVMSDALCNEELDKKS